MKKLIIFVILIWGTGTFASAQKTINKKVEIDGQEVVLDLSFADDLKIEAWNNSFIEISVTVNIDENRYNDFYAINITENKGEVEVKENVDFDGIKKEKGEKKMYNFNSEIDYSIKVPRNLDFNVNTISGEIELLDCLGEMDINTVSGFIDYSIPGTHKVNIELSTVTGDVYSDLKFDNKMSKEISWVGTNRELTINGGDVDVDLKTVSGDIFLRKN